MWPLELRPPTVTGGQWGTQVATVISFLQGTCQPLFFKPQFVGLLQGTPKKDGKPPDLTCIPEEPPGGETFPPLPRLALPAVFLTVRKAQTHAANAGDFPLYPSFVCSLMS